MNPFPTYWPYQAALSAFVECAERLANGETLNAQWWPAGECLVYDLELAVEEVWQYAYREEDA